MNSVKHKEYIPVNQFEFHESFDHDLNNGLHFKAIYIPEELVENILSFVSAKDVLKLTLVCKRWCNIIKSESFWMIVYNRNSRKKAKKLPWYVYYCLFTTDNFDNNLIQNGNGQKKFKHWKIEQNEGHRFRIENPPVGSDPLPADVPEFNGFSSCFVTSFGDCSKSQVISLKKKRLLCYILNKLRPHIYASEWFTGRFDCGCIYKLEVQGCRGDNVGPISSCDFREDRSYYVACFNNVLFKNEQSAKIDQWGGRAWQKMEILIKEYPEGVEKLKFRHKGRDTQFWSGHYGSKMAGGVLKILFDSISPIQACKDICVDTE